MVLFYDFWVNRIVRQKKKNKSNKAPKEDVFWERIKNGGLIVSEKLK